MAWMIHSMAVLGITVSAGPLTFFSLKVPKSPDAWNLISTWTRRGALSAERRVSGISHSFRSENGIRGAADIFQLESAEVAGRLEFDIDLDEARSVECGAQGFRDQPFVPFPHAGKIDDSKDGNLVIREETNRQTVDSRTRLDTKRVGQVFVDLGFREFKCDPLRAQAVGIILKSPENYQNVIAAGCFLAGKRRRKGRFGCSRQHGGFWSGRDPRAGNGLKDGRGEKGEEHHAPI